jgi:hypothetical protein
MIDLFKVANKFIAFFKKNLILLAFLPSNFDFSNSSCSKYKIHHSCWESRPLQKLLLTAAAAGVSTCNSASNAIHHA